MFQTGVCLWDYSGVWLFLGCCSSTTTCKLPTSFEISDSSPPFSFVQNDVYVQFYQTIFGTFKSIWIPCANILKFDFLMLIFLLIWLIVHLKNLEGGRKSILLSSSHSFFPILKPPFSFCSSCPLELCLWGAGL